MWHCPPSSLPEGTRHFGKRSFGVQTHCFPHGPHNVLNGILCHPAPVWPKACGKWLKPFSLECYYSISMGLHTGLVLPRAFLPGFLCRSGFPAMWHCFDACEPGFALQAEVTQSAFSKHPPRQPPDNDKSWFIASPKTSQCFLTDILAAFSHPSLLKPDVKQPRKAVHSHQTI